MSLRFASSRAWRAFFAVSSSGTLPATVVIASTRSFSGEARAARNATASSGDGSLSKMTFIFISTENPEQGLFPSGDVHLPDDCVLGRDVVPGGAVPGVLGHAQPVNHAHPTGNAVIHLHIHVMVRAYQRQWRVEQNCHGYGIGKGDAFLAGLRFVGSSGGTVRLDGEVREARPERE